MAKLKDPIVDKRLFENMYVCMKCNAKLRTKNPKKSKCRKCGSKALRLKNKAIKTTA